MTRKRMALIAAGSAAAMVAGAVLAGVLVLRSPWFHNQVRERMVAAIETATGGRAELGAYRFDWRHLRVEVDRFVLHGTEPSGKPPLVQAAYVAVGLKIVSLVQRDVNIQYLDLQAPHVYLTIDSDGHTNIPEPKIKRRNERTAIETLLNLAIGRFSLAKGVFEVEGRGETPFDVSGRNLGAKFSYQAEVPRYLGDLSIQPLDVHWEGQAAPLPVDVRMSLALERNRIGITSAKLATGGSSVEFSGALDDLLSPRISLQYQASASVSDAARILTIRGLDRGTVQLAGNAQWVSPTNYSVSGSVHASGVGFHQDAVRLQGFRADGDWHTDAKGTDIDGLRIAGESSYSGNAFPVEGRLGAVRWRNRDVEFRNVSLALLGGSFAGEGSVQALSRFRVQGDFNGWEAKRVVAVYNRRQALPWDSVVSGTVTIEGAIGKANDILIASMLQLAPALQGPPVRGQITAGYDARTGALDVGSSSVSLPNSRIEASGAIGRQMRVHLETRDLNDFLPAFGEGASSLPIRLENGSLVFDGGVTGKSENPRISGHLKLARFAYSGESFDSLDADVNASAENFAAQNATLTRRGLQARFRADVGAHGWKIDDSSTIAANGTVRNADVAELLAMLKQKNLSAAGTLTATGQLAGTIGHPQASGDIDVTKGSLEDEPFDRLTAHVDSSGNTLRASGGQLTAGAKVVRFEGSYDHTASSFENGRLHMQMQTNSMPLDQIRTIETARPGVKGTLQITVNGAADLSGGNIRIADLHGDLTANGLELSGQALGDAHLTANSEGSLLRARLDSDFANSMLRGEAEWRLEGDYPGKATVAFSRLDLARVRDWLAPPKSGESSQFTGFANGELQIDGPALKPGLLKAELRIPSLEIGPGPGISGVPQGVSLALRNSGPVVATIANSVVSLERARLVGRSTDLTLSGRVALNQKSPLDLHGSGRVDLALLHDYNNDLASSGTVTLDAGIRGSFDAPQINGRMEVQNAQLNYSDFPNGISSANGSIVFTGDRATIQKLTGETGGGKIELTGFAGYGGGQMIFRLHAEAKGIRVRYPEGVSNVANTSLNFTGSTDRSMLSGTITLLRTGLNLQSDFSSLLAKSAEPVETPESRAGFLGGLNFDIEIQTAPDIQFETSLTQGVQADATLRLRGTAANPALLGRVNITQGQVLFFGTKYAINQGTVSFYNPVKIEPILDVDLQTKARGVDVTLTIAGPLNKLNVTPRSDPPLQFNEIVALLATGRTPSSDPTLLGQQGASSQLFQQSTGTALLGQVIANPVSGRLQRFFGISKLRIDPSLPGIEYNPQARLTLEQQVTPDVTFTYITNVTQANPQVVSVEWSVSKQWSVVALREENGLFGLDFFYKKRFH